LLAYFQEERERINYNWIISKKELEDRKSELINKQREIEDLRENHVMTLNLYKQKYPPLHAGSSIFSSSTRTSKASSARTSRSL
jgi:hypothetical protein